MEGCPKALMINFDLKEISSIEEDAFQKPLSQYIQEYYHEDPKSYSKEIQQITQLRKGLANIPRDKQGCNSLRKYYTQLHYLQSRFPMASGGIASVPFIWHDVYSGEPVIYNDVRYEQACLLFNLGGLYSQLGANEGRLTDESMKLACTYFQSSAGSFTFLKENFALSEMPDMTEEILSLKVTVMLGQSLECILEKSIRDEKNNTLVSRICIQVKDYFNDAINLLNHNGTSEMGSYLRKSWAKHLKIKMLCYEALALSYTSNDALKKEQYGQQVTYLKHANGLVNEAHKLLKNQSDRVVEMVNFIMDVVGNKYNSAVKDNDFIYHLAVPELTALEEITGVSFVKPLPFQFDDKTIAGPDIFQRLIPMRAHEASSMYSEKKADLLRKVTASMQEKDMQLSEYLTAMKIEDLIDPKEDALPDEMVAKNRFLQDNPDLISKVEKNIEELAILASKLDNLYNEMRTKLQDEKADEEQSNGEITQELKLLLEELTRFEEAHAKASKTNSELVKHYNESKGMIEFLSGSPSSILKSLPSQNVVEAPSDEPVVQRIREILGKVDKMKNQRLKLLSQLREELNKDDITSLLAVREKGNKEEFFDEQMKKHDEKVGYIYQNLTAQENIVQALTEANAKYATTREKTAAISAKFDLQVKSYIGVITLFRDVKDRIRSGLDFYKQLEGNVNILVTNIKTYCDKKDKKRPKKIAASTAPPARPTARKPNLMKSTFIPPAHQVPFSNNKTGMDPKFMPGQPLDGTMNVTFNQEQHRFPVQQYPAAGPHPAGPHPFIGDSNFKQSPFNLDNPQVIRASVSSAVIPSGSIQQVHQTNLPGQRFPGVQQNQFPGQQQLMQSNIPQGVISRFPSHPNPVSTIIAIQPQTDNSFNQPRQHIRPNIPPQVSSPPNNLSTPRLPSQDMRMSHNKYNQLANQQQFQPASYSSNINVQRLPVQQYQANIQSKQPAPVIPHPHPSQLIHQQPLPQLPPPRQPLHQQSHPQQPQPRQSYTHQPNPQQSNLIQPQLPGNKPPGNQPVQAQISHSQPSQQQPPQSPGFQKVRINAHQLPSQQQAVVSQYPQQQQQASQSRFASPSPSPSPSPSQQPQYQYPLQQPTSLSRFPSQSSNQQPPFQYSPQPANPHQHISQPRFPSQAESQQLPSMSQYPLQGTNQQQPSVSQYLSQGNQQQPLSQSQFPLQATNQPHIVQTQFPSQPSISHRHIQMEQQSQMQPNTQQYHGTKQQQNPFRQQYLPAAAGSQVTHQNNLTQRSLSDNMGFQQPSGNNISTPYSLGYQGVNASHPLGKEILPMNELLFDNNTLPLPLMPEKTGEPNQAILLPENEDTSLILPRNCSESLYSNFTKSVPPPQIQQTALTHNLQTHNLLKHDSSELIYPRQLSQETHVLYEHNKSLPNQTVSIQTQMIRSQAIKRNQRIPSVEQSDTDRNATVVLPTAPPHQVPLMDSPIMNAGDAYQRYNPDIQQQQQQQQQQHLDYQRHTPPCIPYSGPSITQAISSNHSGLLFSAKPLMTATHDPVISNILGKNVLQNIGATEIAHINFQQISLQNMVLQQQQLIAMLQTQQNQQRSEDDNKIQLLQQQIAKQQTLIDNIKDQKEQDDKNVEQSEKLKHKIQSEERAKKNKEDNEDDLKVIVSSTKESSTTQKQSVNLLETVEKGKTNSMDISAGASKNNINLLSQSVSSDVKNKNVFDEVGNNIDCVSEDSPKLNALMRDSATPVLVNASVLPDVLNLGSENIIHMGRPNPSLDASISNRTTSSIQYENVAINKQTPFYEPKLDSKINNDDDTGFILPRDMEKDKISTNEIEMAPVTNTDSDDDEIIQPRSREENNAFIHLKTVDNIDVDDETDDYVTLSECSSGVKKETPKIASSPILKKKSKQSKKTSAGSSPNVSLTSSPCTSGRSSPALNSSGQVVQHDDVDNKEAKITQPEDYRHLARQLGRLSFYVSGPEETKWLRYIQELDVAVKKLHNKCKNLCKRVENMDIDGFLKIWNDLAKVEELDVHNFSSLAGESNISKNRYRDILPWDNTRVKLTTTDDDYINANLIQNLTPHSPNYIATQGPIPQTFKDFWTMVWEMESRIIVMLTNEVEGTKLKCHHYWSRDVDSPMEFDNLIVILMDETTSSGWKIRSFTLVDKKSDDTRLVKQLQFTSWPDYGTPESPYELLAFMGDVYECHEKLDASFQSPLILHCSAGVGRTGSFCCIYSAIREMKGQNGLIEIPGVVRKLRQYRPHMVQRKEQLIFCYQAILCFAQQFTSVEMRKLCSPYSGHSTQIPTDISNEQSVDSSNKNFPKIIEIDSESSMATNEDITSTSGNYSTNNSIYKSSIGATSQDYTNESELLSDQGSDNISGNSKFKINSGIFQSARSSSNEGRLEDD